MTTKNKVRAGALLALGALAAGRFALAADTPKKPELRGYCPAAYGLVAKAIKGDPKYPSVHNGRLYYLANADAKKAFDANPEKFTIAYDGWCTTGVALGKKLESDPTLFIIHSGVTHLFSSADAKKAFEGDPEGMLANAEANWPRLK